MTVLINTWKELAEVPESDTHYLVINTNNCNGWIVAKNPKSDKFSDRKSYLSTHTFYGQTHKQSTARLQECGFDVEIANWDA